MLKIFIKVKPKRQATEKQKQNWNPNKIPKSHKCNSETKRKTNKPKSHFQMQPNLRVESDEKKAPMKQIG